MKYITLVCMAGMSTSLLVNKMRRAAAENGVEAEIIAMSESAFARYGKPTDVLLLGPQIGYKYEAMKAECEGKGIPVAVIDSGLYAGMDGETVLKNALEMLEAGNCEFKK